MEKKHMTSIGGQALIEGVMMRGPENIAIAVRKPDGEIIIKNEEIKQKALDKKIKKIPILRGVVGLFQSMVTGVKSLMYSAEFYDVEEEKPSKFDTFLEKIFKDKLQSVVIYFSVVLALVLGVGLFILLPAVLANFFKSVITSNLVSNLIEGIIRITFFFVYIYLISKMDDIYRVFQYHGAEHKSIYCYEEGKELTVENAREYTTLHPRCGTSFLLIVMILSILVFSLVNTNDIWTRLLSRILLIPVVAGLSYEFIKWAGRGKTKLAMTLSKPGMWLQKLTTNEPDDDQLEVALAALKNVVTGNKEDDKW